MFGCVCCFSFCRRRPWGPRPPYVPWYGSHGCPAAAKRSHLQLAVRGGGTSGHHSFHGGDWEKGLRSTYFTLGDFMYLSHCSQLVIISLMLLFSYFVFLLLNTCNVITFILIKKDYWNFNDLTNDNLFSIVEVYYLFIEINVVIFSTSFLKFHSKLHSELWRVKSNIRCQSFDQMTFLKNTGSIKEFQFVFAFFKVHNI